MKSMLYITLLGLFAISFIGCRGIEPALFGQEREDYLKSIKPVLYYWNKSGVTEKQKIDDWIVCGGDADGGWHYVRGATQKQEDIRSKNADNCMIKKGYRYERTR